MGCLPGICRIDFESRREIQTPLSILPDGYKAQMAHVKALNKAKNESMDDGPESPHHTPITGRGRNGDSDDDDPVSPCTRGGYPIGSLDEF